MNWRLRASILRTLATLPGGHSIYQLLQSKVGHFHRSDFLQQRFETHRKLALDVLENNGRIEGANMVEVGTGWAPLLPLSFWLCGAQKITTFDLNPYLIPSLVQSCCRWMQEHRDLLTELWQDLCSQEQLDTRFDVLCRHKDRPRELLRTAGIEYRAPADAASTKLSTDSVDIHYSANVFEHIPLETLSLILREAHRILKPGGLAAHHVDTSDHFAHSDPSISRINFLRFEEPQWRHYYDNRYSYLNRCHDSDYIKLFRSESYELKSSRFELDHKMLELLKEGFPLASTFQSKSHEDLCRGSLMYVATPS